jgi:hypothetical protein
VLTGINSQLRWISGADPGFVVRGA